MHPVGTASDQLDAKDPDRRYIYVEFKDDRGHHHVLWLLRNTKKRRKTDPDFIAYTSGP